MAGGRDGIHKPKFNKNLFFLTPEAQKVDSMLNRAGPKQSYPGTKGYNPVYEAVENPGVKEGIDGAITMIARERADAIDDRFGSGAGEWIIKNMDLFDPQERLKLYYMFEGLPKPPKSASDIANEAGFPITAPTTRSKRDINIKPNPPLKPEDQVRGGGGLLSDDPFPSITGKRG